MQEQIKKVKEFHDTFKIFQKQSGELRHKLMAEENDEYLEAIQEDDEVGIADALGDQLYILCGTILNHGMEGIIEKVFEEIHKSNMSKLDESGQPIFREDGKIMKGPTDFEPNIKSILDERYNNG